MRIDEFSRPADIDGTLSSAERTRFLLFGFDIGLSELKTLGVIIDPEIISITTRRIIESVTTKYKIKSI